MYGVRGVLAASRGWRAMSEDSTTTIQITQGQREALRGVNDGSAKAALQDLLDANERDETGGKVPDADEIASAVTKDVNAQLPEKVADAVEDRLR